jgi:hypothetical protein
VWMLKRINLRLNGRLATSESQDRVWHQQRSMRSVATVTSVFFHAEWDISRSLVVRRVKGQSSGLSEDCL